MVSYVAERRLLGCGIISSWVTLCSKGMCVTEGEEDPFPSETREEDTCEVES